MTRCSEYSKTSTVVDYAPHLRRPQPCGDEGISASRGFNKWHDLCSTPGQNSVVTDESRARNEPQNSDESTHAVICSAMSLRGSLGEFNLCTSAIRSQRFRQTRKRAAVTACVCRDQDDRWEPFTRLRIAVLIDALRSFQRNVDSRVTRTPNESAKAERWIFTASEDGPFSFESICHSVKIHPSYLRRALLEWRSNRLACLRVQTPMRRAPVANPRGRVGRAAANPSYFSTLDIAPDDLSRIFGRLTAAAVGPGLCISQSNKEVGFEKKSRTCTVCIAVAVMALALCAPARAQNQPKATVRAGYLTCHVASGLGFVFGSSRTVKCTYTRDQSHTEYYSGSITKFGADIGYLSSAVSYGRWSPRPPTWARARWPAITAEPRRVSRSESVRAPISWSVDSRNRLRCSRFRLKVRTASMSRLVSQS